LAQSNTWHAQSVRPRKNCALCLTMAAAAAPTLTLPAAEVSKLESGKATCLVVEKQALLVLKQADGKLLVAPNTCVHMNQKVRGQLLLEYAC